MNRIKKILIFLFALQICYAGTVTDLIDYRDYRDFAENKGKYKVGNTNIEVNRKDGTVRVITLPMPDFSSTDQSAVGTLIDPNYVAGVKHNKGYQSVIYGGKDGGHKYNLIDRNEKSNRDYHTPRLNKVVTDVVPTSYKEDDNLLQDWKNKYSLFARVGTGMQYIQNNKTNLKDYIAYAYNYRTGGILTSDMLYKGIWINDREKNFVNAIEKSPLPIYIEPGDSGSPLWGYNREKNNWELVGFAMSITANSSIYIPVIKEYMEKIMGEDYSPEIKDSTSDGDILWQGIAGNENKGTGEIVQGNNSWKYDGLKSGSLLSNAKNEDLNFTKHLTFNGEGGTIKLQDNINMGAGKLTFKNNYTMEGINENTSWVGAGIDISKDKIVTWKIKGQNGDSLHKIGEGTLLVQGTGKNEGGLNIGDGIVYLDQKADSRGQKQAFTHIDIVSGRGTVVLGDSEQVEPNKIKFMFRGGKLDVNGNDLKFNKIVTYDDGGQIVNKDTTTSNITMSVVGKDRYTTIFKGHFGEKDIENRDKINLTFENSSVNDSGQKFVGVTGGINIDGDINYSANNLTLVFQGRRETHADENLTNAPIIGDYSTSKFKFNNLYVKNKNDKNQYGFVGGIYSDIEGNIVIEDNSSAILGYINDKDSFGKTVLVYDKNDQKNINENSDSIQLNDSNTDNKIQNGTTIYKGNVTIAEKGSLDVGATYFTGGIEALNSGRVGVTNSQIDAKLNIGESVNTLFKNTIGKLSDSSINNDFGIREKSKLLFENLIVGATGKLNVDDSAIQIDNSKNIDGEILLSKKSTLIGNKSTFGKVTSSDSTLILENTDINNGLALSGKSEASLINGSVVDMDINDSLLMSDGTNYTGKFAVKNSGIAQISKGTAGDIEVTNNSILKAKDIVANNIQASLKGTLDFTGGKITSILAKESVTMLDGTLLDSINLALSTDDNKNMLTSKNSNINSLISDKGYIELTNTNINTNLDLKNKSEMLAENGSLTGVNVDNSTLVTVGTNYSGDVSVNNSGILQVTRGNIANIGVDNSMLILKDSMAGNLSLNSNGKLSITGGETGVVEFNNSFGEIISSKVKDKITLNNNSELNINDTEILANIDINNSNLYLKDLKFANDLTVAGAGTLATVNSDLTKIHSDNSKVTVQGGKIGNIELVNNSIFENLGGTIEDINVNNSKIVSDTSIFNKGITAKNSSNLDLTNSYVFGGIRLNDGTIKTDKTMITDDLNIVNSTGELKNSTITGSLIGDNSKLTLDGTNFISVVPFTENDITPSTISLKNNSILSGIRANITSDITLMSSDIKLNDSNLMGTLNGTGDAELKNSTWNISDNSDIKNLLATSSNINFLSKRANEFHSLTLDNISGDSKITFNANLETGESDKLIIRDDVLNSFATEIAIDNMGKNVELNKTIVLVQGKDSVIDKINITNATVDLGIVQGKVEEVINGSLGLKPPKPSIPSTPLEPSIPTLPSEPTVPDGEDNTGNGNISVETPSYLTKETLGSTSTTMLNEYAVRVEAIKNQNSLFKSEINFKVDEGFNYIGNIQYGKYESDKFREYHQTITNNGFTYKSNNDINSDWTLSKGVGFIYGKSTIDYEGDYTGKVDNYGVYGYLQFLNKNGYYIAPNASLGYNENKINSERFYTKYQSVGAKLGYQKEIIENLKVTFNTGVDMYHISHSDYDLDFRNSRYNAKMNGKYFVELKPEIKISKDIVAGENKTTLYTGVGLEYNKYVLGGKPEVNIIEKYRVQTDMIDKGASIKIGVENSYRNVDIALEGEYFTGKYNNEKLKGNFKLKYKF